MRMHRSLTLLCIMVFLGASTPADAAQGRRAVVQNDATLMIGGRRVHLHGIFVPFADDKLCDARFRPVRCGSRAALALRIKVQGFVFGDYRGRRRDGPLMSLGKRKPVWARRSEMALGGQQVRYGTGICRAMTFALALSMGASLGACTTKRIGQTLYNTGKAYCANHHHRCGGRDDGSLHEERR